MLRLHDFPQQGVYAHSSFLHAQPLQERIFEINLTLNEYTANMCVLTEVLRSFMSYNYFKVTYCNIILLWRGIRLLS